MAVFHLTCQWTFVLLTLSLRIDFLGNFPTYICSVLENRDGYKTNFYGVYLEIIVCLKGQF